MAPPTSARVLEPHPWSLSSYAASWSRSSHVVPRGLSVTPWSLFPYTASSMDHPFGMRRTSDVVRKLFENDPSHGYHTLDLRHRMITRIFGKIAAAELPPAPDIFADSGIEIVPDETLSTTLSQIHRSEAHYFNTLFQKIKEDTTSFQFSCPSFKHRVILLLQSLALFPSGRILIHNLANCRFPIIFEENEFSSILYESFPVLRIELDLDSPYYSICEGEEGPITSETPNSIVLAHEMIHALHFLWKHQLTFLEGVHILSLFSSGSLLPRVSDLNEQMTIFGIPGERMVCENSIRKEMGYPARLTHEAAYFPPFSQLDVDRIHTERAGPYNRMEAAARFGLNTEIRKLIASGADPSDGIFFAVAYGHPDTLQILLEAGGDVEQIDRTGSSLLLPLVHQGNSAYMAVFPEHRADPERKSLSGNTPLHMAASRGNTAACRLLLTKGARIDTKDGNGFTALSRAILKGHPDTVRVLLEHEATVDRTALKALRMTQQQCRSKLSWRNFRQIEQWVLSRLDLTTSYKKERQFR